jgi:hypothetical protein
MNQFKKYLLSALFLTTLWPFVSSLADNYPSRPIKIIVPAIAAKPYTLPNNVVHKELLSTSDGLVTKDHIFDEGTHCPLASHEEQENKSKAKLIATIPIIK